MYCTDVVFAQGPQAYCLINYYYYTYNKAFVAYIITLGAKEWYLPLYKVAYTTF